MNSTKHLIITGNVQGVGYRAWFAHQAKKHALTGWVRNCHNGTVEAILQGKADHIDRMITDAHEGPISASVSDIAVYNIENDLLPTFDIKPTA